MNRGSKMKLEVMSHHPKVTYYFNHRHQTRTLKIVQSSHFTKFKSYLLFAFFLVLSHTRDLCNKLYEYDHTSMSLVLLFLDYIGP